MDDSTGISGWRAAARGALATLLALAAIVAAPLPARPPAAARAAPAAPADAGWTLPASDIAADPAFRFGRLGNGLRYAIRRNPHPAGTVLVRMEVAAGSLDEGEHERGFAHFVEHMAFQGSTRVPPGEMVRLLERKGLAFGADTNAFTNFERTTYVLDLPRADPDLLDTALMLMRETAGALRFDPAQVARERGVILAEKRDRNTWSYRDLEARLAFLHPRARYVRRLPIGTQAALDAATAPALRAFWQRHYVPARTTVIVVGDIDEAAARALVVRHFADWQPGTAPAQPRPGPIPAHDRGRTAVYTDPAMPERLTITRDGPYQDEADTTAWRRRALLRQIGYGIVNRRLEHLARRADPPYRDAGFGTGDVFKAGRTTSLVVDVPDGQWRRGLDAAVAEYRRALAYGFTPAEVAEQVATLHIGLEHAAAAAATRPSGELVDAVFALLHDGRIPATPADALARFKAAIPAFTPAAVLAALREEAVPLDNPRLRFQGKQAPQGGEKALRAAWNAAARAPLARADSEAAGGFAYTEFGPPGTVVADGREPLLGIRTVRFANGVRLNLRHTDLDKDRVLLEMNLDGGALLATRDNPLAVTMVPSLVAGGLGKHSQDDLQTLLAGHAVSFNLGVAAETFASGAQTTPADLPLQLQLLAALLTDPGFRPEGEMQFRAQIRTWYATLDATPAGALGAAIGGILSDNDPRFTLQPLDAYARLDYARLRRDIGQSLAHGAVEIGIVGDIDEDAVIAQVARTLGALPTREAAFRPWADRRTRPWSSDRRPRTVTHAGPADQAMVRETWLTRDDADPVEKQALNLLDRVMRIELTETLRQKLGKSYSPGAASEPSRTYRAYGTFAVAASVDVADVAATRAAIAETVAALRTRPVSADVLQRARAPLAESFDNWLKTNGGWLGVVARAQTEPDRIERQLKARERLLALTAADVQAVARRYLVPERLVDVTVVPRAAPAAPPGAPAPLGSIAPRPR
ncbi:MAG: insulinase family protein [Sphingomonadales bacterium]|nr:insulinase family protein [Sphingomonadales bacterium]